MKRLFTALLCMPVTLAAQESPQPAHSITVSAPVAAPLAQQRLLRMFAEDGAIIRDNVPQVLVAQERWDKCAFANCFLVYRLTVLPTGDSTSDIVVTAGWFTGQVDAFQKAIGAKASMQPDEQLFTAADKKGWTRIVEPMADRVRQLLGGPG